MLNLRLKWTAVIPVVLVVDSSAVSAVREWLSAHRFDCEIILKEYVSDKSN